MTLMPSSGRFSRKRRYRPRLDRAAQATILGYEQGVPVVPVVVRRFRTGVTLYLAVCPYCGWPHNHGGGRPHENPHDYEFHRNSHCVEDRRVEKEVPGDRGYILRIVGEEPWPTRPGKRTTTSRQVLEPAPPRQDEHREATGRPPLEKNHGGPGAEAEEAP
jgi:hypothetical protein